MDRQGHANFFGWSILIGLKIGPFMRGGQTCSVRIFLKVGQKSFKIDDSLEVRISIKV